jgi:endonuclease/exonuclease/phosphatase family metal-dependent hydrolase
MPKEALATTSTWSVKEPPSSRSLRLVSAAPVPSPIPGKPHSSSADLKEAGAEITLADSLRVVTLNVWGLPLAVAWSQSHLDRVTRIQSHLDQLDVDCVTLQEVWTPATLKILTSGRYPFWAAGARPGRLIGGSGLLTLSKHPIVRQEFYPFVTRGGFEAFIRKGVLKTTILIGGYRPVDIYNLHLISEPERGSHILLNDTMTRKIRLAQVVETVEFIARASKAETPVVVAGDFNIDDQDPESLAIKAHLSCDTFHRRNGIERLCFHDRVTFDPGTNHFSRSPHNTPQRLDYIWLPRPKLFHSTWESRRLFVDSVVSDHYGVMSSFTLDPIHLGNTLSTRFGDNHGMEFLESSIPHNTPTQLSV